MDVNFTPRGAASDRCATIVLPVWRTVGSGTLGQSLSLLAISKKSFSFLHLGNTNKKLIEKDQAVNYIQQKSQKKTPPFVILSYAWNILKSSQAFQIRNNRLATSWDQKTFHYISFTYSKYRLIPQAWHFVKDCLVFFWGLHTFLLLSRDENPLCLPRKKRLRENSMQVVLRAVWRRRGLRDETNGFSS